MSKAFRWINGAGFVWLVWTMAVYGSELQHAEMHARPLCDKYFNEKTRGGGA